MSSFKIIDSFKVDPNKEHLKLDPGWWFVFEGAGYQESELPPEGSKVEMKRPDGSLIYSKIMKSTLNPAGVMAAQFADLTNVEAPRLSIVSVAD